MIRTRLITEVTNMWRGGGGVNHGRTRLVYLRILDLILTCCSSDPCKQTKHIHLRKQIQLHSLIYFHKLTE